MSTSLSRGSIHKTSYKLHRLNILVRSFSLSHDLWEKYEKRASKNLNKNFRSHETYQKQAKFFGTIISWTRNLTTQRLLGTMYYLVTKPLTLKIAKDVTQSRSVELKPEIHRYISIKTYIIDIDI